MNQSNKKQNNISLILPTKNEAENVKRNLNWLKGCPVINEVIVIDDNSTDDTVSQIKKLIPKSINLQVFTHNLAGDFSQQKNFGLSKTTNEWILWLDADEKPSKQLIDFINHFNGNKNTAFAFKRQDTFLNSTLKYGETNSNIFVRLFNKNHGKFVGKVHEVWHTSQNVVNQYDLTIEHNSAATLDIFFSKINLYSSIRAQELFERKEAFSLFELLFYPPAKFIQNYFFRLGFLDSTAGIVLALGMSFHSFLVRAKLWHLYQS